MTRYCLFLFGLAAVTYSCQPDIEIPPGVGPAGVVDGIDTLSGLIAEGEYKLVKSNCLACHSGKLITQTRATRDGWTEMIRWMQEKQGLPELGKFEAPIVEYLATYYPPGETGRRPALGQIEWYDMSGELNIESPRR